MLAKDMMTTQVLTVFSSTPIQEAMKLLIEIEISGLIVIDEKNEIVGVVTEKDLIVAFEFTGQIKGPIDEFINRNVISVTEDTPIEEVSRLLVQNNIHRVPVLKDKKVVGVLSRRDILRSILYKGKKHQS